MSRADLSRPLDDPQLDVAELDRRDGGFPEKIHAVFESFGLSGSTSRHRIEEPRHVQAAFSAKEEAILRWLLCALEGPDSSARLDPRSWYLASYLTRRIPIANAALLLSTHKFLQILDSTLCDATNGKRFGHDAGETAAREEAGQRPVIRDAGRDSSSEVSESSATIIGSPLAPVSSPRKRKRQSPSAECHRMPAQHRKSDSGIGGLFSSILLALECILSIAYAPQVKGEQSIITDCSRVHMKAVIRGRPDVASRIMGNWFRMMVAVIDSSEENLDGYGVHANDSYLTPMIQTWQSRSLESGDDPDFVSKAFSSHCLVPALLLLSKFTAMPKKSEMIVDGMRSIESLLAHHILLPARVSFLNSTSANAAQKETDLQTASLLGILLDPLQHDVSGDHKAPGLSDPVKESRTILRAIPLLFEIAIKCSTRTSGKKRGTNTIWIEGVLTTLARSVGLALSPSVAITVPPAKIEVLEQMLQAAIQNEISLSSEVLGLMVVSCSRLMSEATKEIRWTLLEKISRLDEDIFYPSDGKAPTTKGANGELLNSFITQITDLSASESPEGDLVANYNTAKTILMRLVSAFARARNLAGFTSLWQKELEIVERRRSGFGADGVSKATGFSMWEDEDVITEAGSQLVRSLTSKQLEGILVSSELNIRQSVGTAPDPEWSIKAFVNLVTLDAAFSGANQEGNAALEIAQENIRSVYGSLLWLASSTSYLRSHRWRIWRVMSRIQEFWQTTVAGAPPASGPNASSFSNTSELVDGDTHLSLQAAMENACSPLKRVLSGVGQSKKSPQRYFEALLAFDFILYTARVQGSATASQGERNAKVPTEDTLNRSVEFLVLCLSRFGTSAGQAIPVWNGKLHGLNDELSLGVALTARLMIYHPEVLLQFPSTIRTRLFVLLHGLASLNSRDQGQQAPQTRQLSFVRIWNGILSDGDLLRHAKLKDEVIEVLSGFLDTGRSGIIALGIKSSDIRALAVSNLMRLPLEVFRREQREQVLNVLLKSLSHSRTKPKTSADSLTEQISLILKLMDVPNASATLATDPKALWELSEIIGQSGQNPATLAFCGFREIVKKNLRHLLSTSNQERSHQYLISMSESLRDYLSAASSLGNNLGPLQLVRSSLAVLWTHLGALSGDIVDVLQDARGKYLHLLLSDLKAWNRGLGDHASARHSIEALVDTVIELPGLGITVTDDEAQVVLRTVGETISPLFPQLLQVIDGGEGELTSDTRLSSASGSSKTTFLDRPQEQITYIAWLSAYLLKLDRKTVDLSGANLTGKSGIAVPDRKALLSNFHSFAKTLKQADKLALLLYLGEMASQGHSFSGECSILLLRALIVLEENVVNQQTDTSKALSRLYSKLCLSLCRTKGFHQFYPVIDTMELIVSKKVLVQKPPNSIATSIAKS
ncbi:MAG: hypothetical protein M1839_002273 [Geoglossum umbratile]|nr:MAG: hypothetical protein M1839_002273 [Geoglossum umbratile]